MGAEVGHAVKEQSATAINRDVSCNQADSSAAQLSFGHAPLVPIPFTFHTCSPSTEGGGWSEHHGNSTFVSGVCGLQPGKPKGVWRVSWRKREREESDRKSSTVTSACNSGLSTLEPQVRKGRKNKNPGTRVSA